MKNIFVFIFVMISGAVVAQQDIQLSQNMFNKSYFNPAYVGSDGGLKATLFHRSQWVGFEGAPVSQVLTVEMPVYSLSGGLGIQLVNDKVGNGFTTNQVQLSYSFQSQLGDDGEFGLGLNAGIINKSFDYTSWKTPSGGTGTSDDHIPTKDASGTIPDFGLGAYLKYKNYNFSVSTSHLSEGDVELDGETFAKLTANRHFYLYAEASYELNRMWVMAPSIFAKTDQVQYQVDFATNFVYKEQFSVGASYRTFDAVVAMLSYTHKKQFQIGYSYDFTISKLKTYQSGSHEVFVRYMKNINKPKRGRTRYRNNRFL